MSEVDSKVQSELGDILAERAAAKPARPEPAAAIVTQSANPFDTWWALGYRELLPIIPPKSTLREHTHLRLADVGKMPGFRDKANAWGAFKGWNTHATTDADRAEWFGWGASVGLRRGAVLMLDIDAYDEKTANQIETLALEMLGPAPMRVGQWPKRALLYRAPEEIVARKLIFDGPGGKPNQVEMPPQMVVHGVHNTTGRLYEWRRPVVPFAELSPVTNDQLDVLLAKLGGILPKAERAGGTAPADLAAVDQQALKGPPEVIADIMRSLPNTREAFPTYESMRDVGIALHAALADFPELGRELWHEWSEKWEGGDYNEDRTERWWRTFVAPHKFGANFLYNKALRFGDAAATAALWLDPAVPEPLFPEEPRPDLRDGGHKARRLAFTPFGEAADGALTNSTTPLIKGFLDQGAMSVLYGESNTGKTFVAMDIAHHVATGRDWGGMRATSASVVYIAAEGGRGARKRAAALRQRHGDPGGAFLFLLSPIDLLHPNADLGALLKELRTLPDPPGLIVIDTFSRAMAGGDENSSTDMGAMVKHLDAIRDVTGAHVLVVHHSGKDASKGARGHSLLRAAIDTEIEIKDGRITVKKQRDLDHSWSSAFTLETVELGRDADGDAVTSCVLRLLGEHAAAFSEAQLVALREEVGEQQWRLRDSGRGGDVDWIGKAIAVAFGMDIEDKRDKAHVRELQKHLEACGALKIIVHERRKLLVWGAMPSQPDSWCDPAEPAPPQGFSRSMPRIDQADTPPTAAGMFE